MVYSLKKENESSVSWYCNRNCSALIHTDSKFKTSIFISENEFIFLSLGVFGAINLILY